jgi:mitogen-activated protein kinase organizer 1
LISGGGDKACFLWDISSGRIIRRLQAHTQRINTVTFNSDASLIFTGSYDKNLHIWDLRSQTRDPIQTLTDFRDSVTSIALTRTDIIASSVDGSVRIYDLRMGQMHCDAYSSDAVSCVSVSYDQQCLLSTHLGGTLYLTEISTGKLLQSYRG